MWALHLLITMFLEYNITTVKCFLRNPLLRYVECILNWFRVTTETFGLSQSDVLSSVSVGVKIVGTNKCLLIARQTEPRVDIYLVISQFCIQFITVKDILFFPDNKIKGSNIAPGSSFTHTFLFENTFLFHVSFSQFFRESFSCLLQQKRGHGFRTRFDLIFKI